VDDYKSGADPGTQKRRYNVLFICPANAVHSIIAEALLRRWGGNDFCAFSAGIRPSGALDPLTLELLKGQRLWDPGLHAKHVKQFLGSDATRMDFVISVGERPPDRAPKQWPGNPQVIHWRITNPNSAESPSQTGWALRRAFTELETRVRLLVLVYARNIMKTAA
jgi:protein-tyrosine-phosphatase